MHYLVVKTHEQKQRYSFCRNQNYFLLYLMDSAKDIEVSIILGYDEALHGCLDPDISRRHSRILRGRNVQEEWIQLSF